jgi:hypothetical protein
MVRACPRIINKWLMKIKMLEVAQKCYEKQVNAEKEKCSISGLEGVVECEELHHALKPHVKVCVQVCRPFSYCGMCI